MIILALEASTTSAKAMRFNTDSDDPRDIVVRDRRFEVPGPDSSVRDGDSIFTQLAALGREVAAGARVDLIVLSGTWHGLTLREADLSAATPVYEWSYTGAQDVGARLRTDDAFTRWFYERTGCMVNASYPAFKLMHFAEFGLDLDGLIALDQASLNFARLTGEAWTNPSLASGTGLLNARTVDWDDEVRERLGLTSVVLPRLVDALATAPLLPEAAAMLGVQPGIPVLTPGPDGGLNQVGDLATAVGDMTFSMGTSGALRFSSVEPSFSPTLSTWSYRSPLGPLSGAATSGCGNCVDWARERFFGGTADFDQIEPQLNPYRPDLPVFLPFLFGERSPGWQDQRRGGLLDVLPQHRNIDLYQAVLEGITSSLVHCYQKLVEVNGVPDRIILSGGVLSSPFWTQMTVDALGVPVSLSARQHSSITGAVRMGLRSQGLPDEHPALDSAAPRVVEPQAELADHYAERFARYLDQYERTTPGAR